MLSRVAIALASLLAVAACFATIDESRIDASADAGANADANAHADADANADAAADAGPCPAGMIAAPKPAGGTFCIDALEVTNGDYAKYLALPPPPPTQPPACAWNTDVTPLDWDQRRGDAFPVVGVDWCDAFAYCVAMGKHLCRAFDAKPLPFFDQFDDAGASEWMSACSANGARVYPYGDTYDQAVCNGVGSNQAVASGSLAGCVGGWAGLFDMSGNVNEWEDACQNANDSDTCDDAGDGCGLCHVRGGSFGAKDAGPGSKRMTCADSDSAYRGAHYVNTGFRCCL